MVANGTRRPRPSSHSSAKQLLDVVSFYVALLLGASTTRIDFIARRVHGARCFDVYVVCANVVFVGAMPWAFRTVFEYMPSLESNEAASSADRLASAIGATLFLLLLAKRWRRERRLRALAMALFALDARYYDRQRPQIAIERRFNRIHYVKSIAVGVQLLSVVWSTFKLSGEVNGKSLLLAAYFFTLQAILHYVVLQHFGWLWQVDKRFQLLNAELRRLMVGQHGRQDVADLGALAQVHLQLTQLIGRVNESSRMHTMAVLLWYLMINIIGGYYSIMVGSRSVDVSFQPLDALFGAAASLGFFVDINIFFWLCDETDGAQQEAAQILQQHQTARHADTQLERQVAIFAMQLKHSQLRIDVGGFVQLNKASGLEMWIYTAAQVLVLVQFEYAERLQCGTSWTSNKKS